MTITFAPEFKQFIRETSIMGDAMIHLVDHEPRSPPRGSYRSRNAPDWAEEKMKPELCELLLGAFANMRGYGEYRNIGDALVHALAEKVFGAAPATDPVVHLLRYRSPLAPAWDDEKLRVAMLEYLLANNKSPWVEGEDRRKLKADVAASPMRYVPDAALNYDIFDPREDEAFMLIWALWRKAFPETIVEK